jgi:hypothetical protein
VEADMPDYLFLMHNDAVAGERTWAPYVQGLLEDGILRGGSAIGDGVCERKNGVPATLTAHLVGFMRVKADSLEHARSLLAGNPVFEAGGTVEIRELPQTA